MHEPPFWVKGKPLKAKDFIALEDYIFSRELLLKNISGVHDLNYDSSIKILPEERKIIVGNVRGLTISGHPVDLSEKKIVANYEGEDILSIKLAVEVNSVLSDFNPESEYDKYKLLVGKAVIQEDPNQLYLGDYSIDEGNKLRIVERPAVTRLNALKPWDSAWKDWVSPISEAIRMLEDEYKAGEWNEVKRVLFDELCQLSYSWPHILVTDLSFKLQYMRWLRCLAMERARISGDAFEIERASVFISGNEIPSKLAKIITEGKCPGQLGEEISTEQYEIDWDDENGQLVLQFFRYCEQGELTLHIYGGKIGELAVPYSDQTGNDLMIPLFNTISDDIASVDRDILVYKIPLPDGLPPQRRLYLSFPQRVYLSRVFHISKS